MLTALWGPACPQPSFIYLADRDFQLYLFCYLVRKLVALTSLSLLPCLFQVAIAYLWKVTQCVSQRDQGNTCGVFNGSDYTEL